MRSETIPGAARFFSAGPRHHHAGAGPHHGAALDHDARRRAARRWRSWPPTRSTSSRSGSTTRDGKFKKLTPEIYGADHRRGAQARNLRVTAHIFDLEDAKGLMRAGLDAFAHGVRDKDIDDEMVAMFKERPNLVLDSEPAGARREDGHLTWLKAGMPADEYEKLEKANDDQPTAQAFYGIQARNLAKLNAPACASRSAPTATAPWGPHEEMEDMVVAGMTPMQVIVAATRNGAEFLRLADAGTLAAGKSADFIVLDANPLDDITNTRKISAVYLRGAAVDRSQPVR